MKSWSLAFNKLLEGLQFKNESFKAENEAASRGYAAEAVFRVCGKQATKPLLGATCKRRRF